MKAWFGLLAAVFIACSTWAAEPPKPYPAWRLGFVAPDYMDVWLETADVTDVNGQTFTGAMAGTVSIWQPANGKGDPARNLGPYILGAGVSLHHLELPKRLFVRWQSLVEPQTYRATVDISASVRQLMRKRERVKCPMSGWADEYRDSLAVMLAPGGIVKVWLGSSCFPAVPVARVQAEIEPLGPDQGQSGGQYALPLKPAAKAYIDQHGIPYGAW